MTYKIKLNRPTIDELIEEYQKTDKKTSFYEWLRFDKDDKLKNDFRDVEEVSKNV